MLYKGGLFVSALLLITVSCIHAEMGNMECDMVLVPDGISHSCNPPETFEEKLDRIVEYVDTDHDGVITAKDRDRDLIFYDQNFDSFVSPYEFVMEWTCRYGDEADVAYRIFNQLTEGSNLLTFELYRNIANQTVADYRSSLFSFYTQSEINGK